MGRSRIFQFCYFIVLTAFLVSCAILGIRSIELEEGDSFYREMGATDGYLPVAPSRPILPAAAGVHPQTWGKEGQDGAAFEWSGLPSRVSRLSQEYPDVAAWLWIPGTSVDYPVMLGGNNEFYLDHLPNGQRHVLGSLFFDYRSHWDSIHWDGSHRSSFQGNLPHLIIYGHSGSGGRMFGALKQYESQDFFREHAVLVTATSEAAYICPIFSVRRVEAGGDAYVLGFEDQDILMSYVCQAAEASLYPTDACLDHVAGVLTLSTCTGYSGERLVVQAVLPQQYVDARP